MCQTCGCGDPAIVPVDVHERILAGNDRTARHNREHFVEHGVLAINLMGSPGSGKTAILEATARALAPCRAWQPAATQRGADPPNGRRAQPRLAAISGDLATDHDAARLRAVGVPSVSITTGSACHLDAEMVHHALHELPWSDCDFLFIENVGNLVCPAVYDLGQAVNVVALAVTEGEDKPLKYPVMFRTADLVLLTKIDLLPHLPDIRLEAIEDALARVMPRPLCFPLSARSGDGLGQWFAWLEAQRRNRGRVTAAAAAVAV
jgi:hydrogenase nickel incorporation protein HypB